MRSWSIRLGDLSVEHVLASLELRRAQYDISQANLELEALSGYFLSLRDEPSAK